MAGCCPRSVFCEIMDLDSVSVDKHAKKRTWPISSHLDLTLGQNPSRNMPLTLLFLEVMNAAVVITVMGHQEVNKPSMYTLPWAFARRWNGEVHTRDELLTQAKQNER